MTKYSVVRCKEAGSFYGEIISRDGLQNVEIKDARRIYYWEGASTLSELAQHGVTKPDLCKFPCKVDLVIVDAIEILTMTDEAYASLEGVKEWKMRK